MTTEPFRAVIDAVVAAPSATGCGVALHRSDDHRLPAAQQAVRKRAAQLRGVTGPGPRGDNSASISLK